MKTEQVVIGGVALLVLLWLWTRSGGGGASGATLVPLGASDPATDQARLAAQSQAFGELTQAFSSLGLEQLRSQTDITIADAQARAETSRIAAALAGMKYQTDAQLAAAKSQNKSQTTQSFWNAASDVGTAVVTGLLGGGRGYGYGSLGSGGFGYGGFGL